MASTCYCHMFPAWYPADVYFRKDREWFPTLGSLGLEPKAEFVGRGEGGEEGG